MNAILYKSPFSVQSATMLYREVMSLYSFGHILSVTFLYQNILALYIHEVLKTIVCGFVFD